jgi:hypothetical protein
MEEAHAYGLWSLVVINSLTELWQKIQFVE